MMKLLSVFLCLMTTFFAGVSAKTTLDWGDMGDGTYKNPILNADYSDPDVIRVGDTYYMVASDFHFMGMQVLESKDMVNWHLISQIYDRFDFPGWDRNAQYANGAWAPSLRYHDGQFWMFVCTPEEGLLMSKATDPRGPWSPLHCVAPDKKWEDPCPLWDDDGQAYLVRSKHRAGPIIVHKMSPDGRRLLDEGVTVYTGPVAEGPKCLKRNGYYYILIPEGGVETGWQTVLRSKNVYGPYESSRVLETGTTDVNGPHQGALVDTPEGEWWFYHFQSTNPCGRVVHLQPASWTDDGWIKMGEDYDGNGVGEPVRTHRKPNVAAKTRVELPATSDDFKGKELVYAGQTQRTLGLQWQWCHNPVDSMWSMTERKGWISMCAMQSPDLRNCRNMLSQKTMGYRSVATVKMDIRDLKENTYAGLLYTGKRFCGIGVCHEGVFTESNSNHRVVFRGPLKKYVYLRVEIDDITNTHQFSYSLDGKTYRPTGRTFDMSTGFWKGTRVGLFCYNTQGQSGAAHFDSFEYEIVK